jgi:hypothetical protein
MTSRRALPARVPCAVCLAVIEAWSEDDDDVWRARPCGHLLVDINQLVARVPRAAFGRPLTGTAAYQPA